LREVLRELRRGCLLTIGVGVFLLLAAATTMSVILRPPAREVNVPNLIGLEPQAAQQQAQAMGLVAEVAGERYDDVVGRGLVCMTDPAPGRRVRQGRRIFVYLSRGPLNAVVPNVTGLSLQEAAAALERRGLAVGEVYYKRSAYNAGVVVGQVPSAGTKAASGTRVELQVSGGPDYGRVRLPDGRVRLFRQVIVRLPEAAAPGQVRVEKYHAGAVEVVHEALQAPGTETKVDLVGELGDRVRVYLDEKKVLDREM
jgi:serine/threonine-protein kinase